MKERMSREQRSKRGKRAAVVGIAANAIMFAAKLLVGIASSSGAVLADSVNSLSDSVTGVVNYFGFYMSGNRRIGIIRLGTEELNTSVL